MHKYKNTMRIIHKLNLAAISIKKVKGAEINLSFDIGAIFSLIRMREVEREK